MKNGYLSIRQKGMTLIEIMIALVIGAFLLGGVLQIFFSSNQTFRMQDNLSRLQENGRFAMDFISRDIRMVDNWGCLSTGLEMISNNTKAEYNITNSLIGIEGGPDDPDGIAVVGANGGSFAVTAQASATGEISVAAEEDEFKDEFKDGERVLISDCSGGDFFTIDGVDGVKLSQDITAGPDVSKAYGTDATVSHVVASVYFIQNGANGRPALWRTASGDTNELVEDIEDMQILYGEDTDTDPDGTPNYYVSASAVTDMDNVVSVRITLTSRTPDNNLTTTGDGRLRRTFSSTITLRNRLP